LQFALGFKRLGCEVLFLDQVTAGMCADESGKPTTLIRSVNARYFLRLMEQFGLSADFSLVYNRDEQVVGLPREKVLKVAREAACLINVMGYLDDEEVFEAIKRRVFVDIDPGFGQMWRELGLHDPFAGHTDFVTLGRNIGRPDCTIPTCGLKWITMPQPVVLEHWPVQPPRPEGAFTSIGAWRGPNAPIEYQGHTYGLRVHEFRKFVELPKRVTGTAGAQPEDGLPSPSWEKGTAWEGHPPPPSPQPSPGGRGSQKAAAPRKESGNELPHSKNTRFEMALDIHPADAKDIELLRSKGWSIVDPLKVAGGPEEYRAYIAGSKAEFMVPKQMYVDTNSGLLSDRSVYYLASGRPVLARDTGIKHLYPTGEGLLTFSTLDEAVAGVEEINGNYARHCTAAREIAEEYFDSDKVLRKLLNDLGV
jgi:hypothetical protein